MTYPLYPLLSGVLVSLSVLRQHLYDFPSLFPRPDYAPESSSDESEEEFIVKKTKQKSEAREDEGDQEEEILDRRLRRLQVNQALRL